MSKEFLSDESGRVSGVRTVRVEWVKDDEGRWQLKELPDTEHVSTHADSAVAALLVCSFAVFTILRVFFFARLPSIYCCLWYGYVLLWNSPVAGFSKLCGVFEMRNLGEPTNNKSA